MPYIPRTSHVTLLATLRRERRLPLAGQVNVEARQAVSPADVVATADVADAHRLVDVARGLGVPPDKADAAMLKRDGDPVKAGEPIAARKAGLGLWQRRVRSPVTGRLVASAGGKALVASISKPYELRAGLPGTILAVTAGHGVVVETTGALLEGVWGNGRDAFAPLQLLSEDPQHALAPTTADPNLRGAIVAVGVLSNSTALQTLVEARVSGLVLGTLAVSLLPAVEALALPVLVVEGFGRGGFSAPALGLLRNHTGREAWLNAVRWDRHTGQRPELIVPLPSPATPPPPVLDGAVLAPGKRVRVLRGPLAGQVGSVVEVGTRLMSLPSGVRARLASVKLLSASGELARVPFQNLELVE